jgi:hypothetical protein
MKKGTLTANLCDFPSICDKGQALWWPCYGTQDIGCSVRGRQYGGSEVIGGIDTANRVAGWSRGDSLGEPGDVGWRLSTFKLNLIGALYRDVSR